MITYGSEHEYAGFWIRAGASFIDGIIIIIITMPLMYMAYGDDYLYSEDIVLGLSDVVLNYVFPLCATIAFWVYKSATPGKMAIKATVVDAKTGNSLTVKQSIIRYLGYFVSTIPLGLGIFWVGWDSKKQGWHDKLAGTVVIRPRNKGVEKVSFGN
ncbi:RDD family protein [Photobacterium kasasachensis]|uniref:RDD family protein n=1 Tax=Photobacterium kasasachensis TaxID=2910240 RepID=UPI003D0A410E